MMKKLIYSLLLLIAMSSTSEANRLKQSQTTNSSSTMNYSILILYRVTPSFLSLSRSERNQFFEEHIGPIIQKYDGKVSIRMFDSEAFHAAVSDFLFLECADLQDYYFFMEELRDTELFGKPYLELHDVIIGIEDGFSAFESSN